MGSKYFLDIHSICESMKMRVLILLAILGAALAVPKNSQRIVGGKPTTVDDYPFMSNMQYVYFGIIAFQACGGTLLTPTAIMSASHCYWGDLPSQWRVLLGTSSASSGGTSFTVSRLILHADYNPITLINDIAMIHLSTPAVLGNTIGVASIPSYNLADDSVLTTVGWGALSSGGSSPEQLQHVEVRSINQEICAERYAELKTRPGFEHWPDITEHMLCAGLLDVGGADACQGDSGGPLVQARTIAVGVTSWGFGCADPVFPGVYARVSYYTEWIMKNAM